MNAITDIRPTRRGAIKAAGLFALGFHLAPNGALAQAEQQTPEINAWVVIHPDDSVVLRMARSEMGQGTRTGIVQMIAEELHCAWGRIGTQYVTPGQSLARNRAWGNFLTAGSQGVRQSQDYVRRAGAAARIMLVQAAATRWNVPAAECSAKDSVITHTPSGRTLRYGQVAAEAARLTPPNPVPLKDPREWTVIGQPMPRLDTAEKTTGKLVYGSDIRMPGMLVAVPRRCPVFGGTVRSFDANAVRNMPGVKHVLQAGDSCVAVVADTFWQAKVALDALPIEWNRG